MGNKHKHYDLIVAWAKGEKIEYQTPDGDWEYAKNLSWSDDVTYRIKEEDYSEKYPILYKELATVFTKKVVIRLLKDLEKMDANGNALIDYELLGAFTWEKTAQGYDFWTNVSALIEEVKVE